MAKYRVSTKNFSVEVKSRLSFRDQMNERELNYILQNQIPGLFVTSYVGKKRLIYEAPQAESIKKYLKKHRLLKENSFWKIASQIVHIAIETESRGLRASRLLIDKDLMCIRENTMDMFFIYQPAAGPDRADGVFVFLLDLVYREIKNGGGMNQDYLFDFQNYLQQYGHELERIVIYRTGGAMVTSRRTGTFVFAKGADEQTGKKRRLCETKRRGKVYDTFKRQRDVGQPARSECDD